MSEIAREKTEIPCPGGGSPIRTTYGDLTRKRKMKSSRGHEYHFNSRDQSLLKRTMDKIGRLQRDFEREMTRAQKDFGEAYSDLLSGADVLIKK